MFGADPGIVEAAGDGINRRRLAFFVLQQIAFETVDDAGQTVGDGGGVVTGFRSAAQRLDAPDFARIV